MALFQGPGKSFFKQNESPHLLWSYGTMLTFSEELYFCTFCVACSSSHPQFPQGSWQEEYYVCWVSEWGGPHVHKVKSTSPNCWFNFHLTVYVIEYEWVGVPLLCPKVRETWRKILLFFMSNVLSKTWTDKRDWHLFPTFYFFSILLMCYIMIYILYIRFIYVMIIHTHI